MTNIRFSNRKEDEWIKSADVTFSIVVFTNALTIPSFRGFFIFAVEGLTAKTAKRRSPRKKPRFTANIVQCHLKICNKTGFKKNKELKWSYSYNDTNLLQSLRGCSNTLLHLLWPFQTHPPNSYTVLKPLPPPSVKLYLDIYFSR